MSDQQDGQSGGNFPENIRSGGSLVWQFETGGAVKSSPTIVDGTVFIGSDDNRMYALDAETGEERWAFETGDAVVSSPTVADGTVYIGSEDNYVYALDVATGQERWSVETGGAVESSPIVADETVFVGSYDNHVYALGTDRGKKRWSVETSSAIESSLTVDDGSIFVASAQGDVYSIAQTTGELEWTVELDDWVYSSPTVSEGTLFVEGVFRTYALDTATGGQNWSRKTEGGISSPTVYDGTVFVGGDDQRLHALDAAGGKQEWTFETKAKVRSSPTVVDGIVFVGSHDRKIYALDATTGRLRWAERTGDWVKSSPTVVDGTVFVGSDDGCLYALEGGINGSSADSRVLLGTLGHHASQLSTVRSHLDMARQSRDAGEYDHALTRCERAIELAEQVSENAVDDATALRADIRAERDARQRVTNTLDDVVEKLDAATEASDSHYALDGVSNSLKTARELVEKHEFSDSTERLVSLENRYGRIRQEMKTRAGAPETITDVSQISLSYDDIVKDEPIGSGGNADVYQATATAADGADEIAVKEPRMSGTLTIETAERMMDEAETWQQLDDHDHIVSVVDYGSEPLPWIAMEYMDAGHLGERAEEFDFEQALWTAIATTKGVRHAHRRGVAHLDLKPENILFRSVENRWDVPKVADWGLSKHLLKHSKSVEGLSPHYAAPEQFDDEYGSTDDVTDIYQLGAVFYELFTGHPPFEGSPARVMNRVLTETPPAPGEVADVPRELDEILTTALSKEKNQRYESVLYLRDDLQELRESV